MKKLESEFKAAWAGGWELSNFYEGAEAFLEKLRGGKLALDEGGENYFFYENKRLYFFIKDEGKIPAPRPCYTGIIHKGSLGKYENFIVKNKFSLHQRFVQMSLKNENIKLENDEKIKEFSRAKDPKLAGRLRDFFVDFFDEDYLFTFDKNELESMSERIIFCEEKDKIVAGLLFSRSLNAAFVEFIAAKQEREKKDAPFALLQKYFLLNQDANFFKLFVDEKNEKAIKFYERAGFIFNKNKLDFYKNF